MLLVLAGTLLLYAPWRRLPFDITDFSEFLPLLHRPTFYERWRAFLSYYASQGRWNVLSYLGLITKWSMFGMRASGWQVTRFAQLWLVIWLVYLVLRRFGGNAWGAAAGAALFTVATPAVSAWLRLTMGEPLGFVFLLAALLLATGYRLTAQWRRDGIVIAVLFALALLAKEMLVAFVPFVVLVACCQSTPGRLEWPRTDRRTAWLLAASALATIAVVVPVAMVVHNAPHGNFASQFGGLQADLGQITRNFTDVLLPETQSRAGEPMTLFTAPANALFLVVLAAGLILVWRRGTRHVVAWGQLAAWGALALSLPVSVVVAYEPWSSFQDFYGLPYLMGASMLLAGAVTAVERFCPRLACPARGLCAGVLLFAGVRDTRQAQESMARRRVQGDAAAYLAANSGGGPVLVMKSDVQPTLWARWQDTGPTLGRYAAAVYPEAGLQPFRDTTCAVPPRPYVVGGHSGTVVSYAADCGGYPGATTTLRATYRFPQLYPPALREDSIRIDICDSTCTR